MQLRKAGKARHNTFIYTAQFLHISNSKCVTDKGTLKNKRLKDAKYIKTVQNER